MKEIPKPEELLEGRMEDGSRPPLYSAELYEQHREDAFGRKLPVELRGKSMAELTADDLMFEADLRLIDDYDFVSEMGRFMANTGRARLEAEGAEANSPGGDAGGSTDEATETEPQSTKEAASETTGDETPPDMGDLSAEALAKAEGAHATEDAGDSPASSGVPKLPPLRLSDIPGGQAKKPRSPSDPTPKDENKDARELRRKTAVIVRAAEDTQGTKPRRASKRAIKNLSLKDAAALIHHGCKLITSVAAKRAEVFKRLVQQAMSQDIKQSFIWDRAHAVVASTLLHLDDEFDKVGFGSWMPFRYPDQWLMFVGVMRRVLAANGLIHSDNPEQYRKLLEETDPVVPEIEDINERIDWWKTPENWSTSWSNRGARTLEDLRQRLMDEVWDPTTRFGGTRAPPESP